MLIRTLQNFAKNYSTLLSNRICVSPEVQDALNSSKGVVALESTVITHGLPRPHNLQLARKMEKTIRENGAVPATIALLDGKVHVGLSDQQLQRVAEVVNSVKVSKRDIPIALAKALVGGTTVAATMYLANAVGIRVFATGGLGGVHRGASESFDISADLLELSRTPVVVVCAGVKSILDVPKTLEYLVRLFCQDFFNVNWIYSFIIKRLGLLANKTFLFTSLPAVFKIGGEEEEDKVREKREKERHIKGHVNVVVYGDNTKFPGFFTPETESKAPFHTKSLHEIFRLVECSRSIGLQNGFVIACPIPSQYAAHGENIENAIQKALRESVELKITSKNVTPFVLKRVCEITGGESLKTNMALLENDAVIASKLARIFARNHSDSGRKESIKSATRSAVEVSARKKEPSVVVVGATILDFETITQCDIKRDGGSYVGQVVHRCGGVGQNHANALTRLGNDVKFISIVGKDLFGDCYKEECNHMDLDHVITLDNVSTAVYVSVNVKGNVLYGISAIEGIIGKLTPELIKSKEKLISSADYVLLDGNISIPTMKALVEMAYFNGVKTWFEPTDIAKMRKIFDAGVIDLINITSPNLNEFISYCSQIGEKLPDEFGTNWDFEKIFEMINKGSTSYLRSLDTLIITLGPKGTIVLRKEGEEVRHYRLAPPVLPEEVVSVSGAGDCFNSGFLTGILNNLTTKQTLELAQKCAETSLRSLYAVPEELEALRLVG